MRNSKARAENRNVQLQSCIYSPYLQLVVEIKIKNELRMFDRN